MNLAKTLTRTLSRTMSTSARPSSSLIPTISTLPDLRAWRQRAFKEDKSVGVVPTMGALHEGHLDLVRHSLRANPLTVLTLFVNPTQFAPHEDLSSYPRTLPRDLELLENLLRSEYPGKEMDKLVVWTPSRETMYPLSSLPAPASGSTGESMLQDVNKQRGAFVEVKGWGDVLEGASRPQFFRGVATVCTKLFNAVQPDHAYFGQKDIQQALLLKIMLKDLLTAYPTTDNLHIIPTTRDTSDHLALSSRNAYLTEAERPYAPTLHRALSQVRSSLTSTSSSISTPTTAESAIQAARDLIETVSVEASSSSNVSIKYDYIEVFDKVTFEPIRGELLGREAVVAGAIWVGKTRLIDNLLIGWDV